MNADDADIVVIGGGDAAFVSALTAADAGARVLERAPVHFRGGNSRHTRNIGCARGTMTSSPPVPTPSMNSGATCAGWGRGRGTTTRQV
ncbi:hypothetical protein [Streptomyces sp. NPDC060002]|uniref:hypothetical protein n=1 Tax=Streptomyces sp. NPDC060002 TaxID=3347033 RepID=UPI0036AB3CA8